MPTILAWPLPPRVAELPDDMREAATVRYMLGVAAAYLQDRGNLSSLARALDCPIQTLHTVANSGRVTAEMAVTLERVLGREHFPREMWRPDLFIL